MHLDPRFVNYVYVLLNQTSILTQRFPFCNRDDPNRFHTVDRQEPWVEWNEKAFSSFWWKALRCTGYDFTKQCTNVSPFIDQFLKCLKQYLTQLDTGPQITKQHFLPILCSLKGLNKHHCQKAQCQD